MEEQNESRIQIEGIRQDIENLKSAMTDIIVGQEKLIDLMLCGLISSGHVLIEGVPGVAKTLSVKLLSSFLSLNYSRIQFTPDLMPSDVIGTMVFDPSKKEFSFRKGPVFTDFLLIDEINRAPAKTQSALFEVMEERQISMDGTTYQLEPPFIVYATQNPVEHEGVYRLPEAQLDRFLLRIELDYPEPQLEIEILKNEFRRKGNSVFNNIHSVLTSDKVLDMQKTAPEVLVEEKIMNYITEIVLKTRSNPSFYLGASPRASIHLMRAAQSIALIRGRDFVVPDDVKYLAEAVLCHRVIVAPEKIMEGLNARKLIRHMVDSVEVPR